MPALLPVGILKLRDSRWIWAWGRNALFVGNLIRYIEKLKYSTNTGVSEFSKAVRYKINIVLLNIHQ